MAMVVIMQVFLVGDVVVVVIGKVMMVVICLGDAGGAGAKDMMVTKLCGQ